jgi:aromatic ring-opening dioxygenase LigB subunit
MLVFAGFLPNSPLLFPSINTARMDELTDTVSAVKELSEDLYAVKPDTIVILAASQTLYPDAFSLNVADPYTADLSDVGDLGYQKKYHPDFGLIDALQRHARQSGAPVTLSTDEKLHSATAIPLHFLTEHLPQIRIVPITPSGLDGKMHFTFGAVLKHVILESSERIAVIGTGDMSHALKEDAPGGFHEDAEKFEEKMLGIIKERSSAGLIQLDPELVKNAQDTSYREFAMLFGVLDGIDATPSILSYEKPFGVGYAVVNFLL